MICSDSLQISTNFRQLTILGVLPCLTTHFEDVKTFVLHHLAVVLELPHDELEVFPRFNVSCHDIVELSIQ